MFQHEGLPITTIRTSAQHMDAGYIITNFGKVKTNTAYMVTGKHSDGGTLNVCFFIAHNFNSRQELYPLLCFCSYHVLPDNSMCQIAPQIEYINSTFCSDCETIFLKLSSIIGQFSSAIISAIEKREILNFAKFNLNSSSFSESVEFYCN